MEPARLAVLTALRSVVDPEAGLDIVNLGLIHRIQIDPGEIRVGMTLTSPGCPLGETILTMARQALDGIAGERRVFLELSWDPPWNPGMISPGGLALLRGHRMFSTEP